MALVAFHGSEWGNSGEAQSSSGTIDFAYTAIKHSGRYATRLNPTAAASFFQHNGLGATGAGANLALTTGYGGAWWYPATLPSASIAPITLINSAGNPIVRMIYQASDGQWVAQYANGSDVDTLFANSNANGFPEAVAGQGYFIEIAGINIGTVGGASVEARINGQVFGTASGLTVRSSLRTIDLIQHGSGNTYTADMIIDDSYVDNAGFLGEILGEPLTPNAAGAAAAWATGTGSTFAEVDDLGTGTFLHDTDTTYIKSSSNGNASTFAMTDSPSTVNNQNIQSVKASALVRDEGGASSMRLRLRSSATNNDTTNADHGATYVVRSEFHNVDPATTAAWTKAGVDAVEVGVVNAANVAARCTALLAQVIHKVPVSLVVPSAHQRSYQHLLVR